MKPLQVIDILDKGGNTISDIFSPTLPKMHLLRFKGFYKALKIGIIKRITLAAHADLKSIKIKLFEIFSGCILNAGIRMINTSGLWVSVVYSPP